MRNTTLGSAAVIVWALAGAGCGTGAAAEAIRPADPTANKALGEAACHEVEATAAAEPLVVDWKPEQRGDLEEAMHDGVAVVAYSCQGIKLLKECKLDGNYGYLGMTRREQVVRLSNSDELRANLPSMGGALAAKIGGEMERGATLDIAMVMVGKKRTTWATASKDDLKGTCEGATHFVRSAMVGAFAMDTGTKAKARVTGEVFGVGAAAGSSSEKSVKNKEGDIGDCQTAAPDSPKAPAQCGAAVRLVLSPIAAGAKQGEKPAEAKPVDPATVAAPEVACPKGLVMAEGKCTAPKADLPFQCKAGDAAECTAQCDKGHLGSCTSIGVMLASGRGASRDAAKAAPALKKACDGSEAAACTWLGRLTAEGAGVAKDAAAANALFDKGCVGGDAPGCTAEGKALVATDAAKAATLLEKGCAGGDDAGCAAAAPLFAEGRGVKADVAKAAGFYKRACDGTDAASCNALGQLHELGKDVRKDPIYATMLYRRGCFRMNAQACTSLARMDLGGAPGGIPDEGKRVLDQGCMWRDSLACAILKVGFGDSRPVFPDVAQSQALQRSCDGGSARDCSASAMFDLAMGNKPMGMTKLDRACIQGDKFACEMKKKVK
jgi:TPR repeat protein